MLCVSMVRETPSQLPTPVTPSVNQNEPSLNWLDASAKAHQATATVSSMQSQLNFRNCQQHDGGRGVRQSSVVRCGAGWDAPPVFSFPKWRSSRVPGSARSGEDVGQDREAKGEKSRLLNRTVLVIIKNTLERMACGEPRSTLPWRPMFSGRSIKND